MGQWRFSAEDLAELRARGLSEEAVLAQIARFERGIPPVRLRRACTLGDGITALAPEELPRLAAAYEAAAAAGRAMKFVPASGAASRMFQLLLTFYHQGPALADVERQAAVGERAAQDFLRFWRNLERFAFYDDLRAVLARDGYDLERLRAQGQYREVLAYLLFPQGLDYAHLPKALLKFHRYADHCRTPLEEHLVEAAAYACDRQGLARLHFTVSPAHRRAVEAYLARVRPRYERDGRRYEVTLSEQQPATDTLAVDLENRPFRDAQGRLLFRPAGHGALLDNLNALQGDLVFIKNIDNVVPDHLKAETYIYKKALAGYLVTLQERVFAYLRRLARGDVDAVLLAEMAAFARERLWLALPPDLAQRPQPAQQELLWRKLNRPLRVCGMVPNTGEPGGGPFWVELADGTLSLQIVELSQVDMASAEQRAIVEASTHFNPVDMVCGVRDYLGRPFDLRQFADPEAGIITVRSHEGRPLKALELPGLWNGGMAYWNTVFVEVPLHTFTPVKTVLDLLRPEHQPPA
ncbi:MAG: hypothetical protein KatS3mg131_1174 [Candidatus Tectimicrobiota bacterium]|nr:MAG: hypothetical protein KatS3mg131_1174 [Candidatus Tectomicrobia bacterium]